MTILAWSLLVLGAVAGFIGTIVPALPGIALIFIGALAHKLILPEYLAWWTVAGAGVAIGLSWGIDLLGTVAGAKWGGATKWGMWGALVGGLLGLFFGLPGLLIGPLAGAFAGELISSKRSVEDAAKAGVGAGLGIAVSTALRVLLALLVIVSILLDCFVF